ncbi:hypothetical protein BDV32DRAFT_117002 [Aspergillus pseudonomiae]|uniref:CASTOR ACT domain-containing protein n=2 Tax=Aspergillus subgen. Circumdati TaxID=2720871 RepID=A0A0L1ITG0_ASPN3|nr:uncharacterized protein ANOM_008524 [Aspergillus nomiae NRRL 13137]XP_031935197.1 uncharacterized protein BDV37DRAFT_264710 [Aspergillus pseudonomiae]KAB8265072.1 hypothetical protein BDV32DRAFT_117002 [Aspergillus pseudonomiae]KAE8397878.1 hypothetical protein BDV37DRAFT_264710 [Aspergillus pseudonomiae]KNG82866.1 hypothetical protein ANOM_008524 [Aspergillus nomiae NRRL 13137]
MEFGARLNTDVLHSPEKFIQPGKPEDITKCKDRQISVSAKENISLLCVNSNRNLTHYGFYARILSIIDDSNIPVELLLTSDNCVTIAIDSNAVSEDALKAAQAEMQPYSRPALAGDMVMLSVKIASKLHCSEVLSSTFSILSACCIPVHMISLAADEPIVYCVISKSDVSRAQKTLYSNLHQHYAWWN